MCNKVIQLYILHVSILFFPENHDVFSDSDNQDGVVTHLEQDIPECEIKWSLGSITANKASRGDGIPAELYQILKYDVVKVPHTLCQQI